MRVEDIMTVDVVSVDVKDSLAGALALMNEPGCPASAGDAGRPAGRDRGEIRY